MDLSFFFLLLQHYTVQVYKIEHQGEQTKFEVDITDLPWWTLYEASWAIAGCN